MLELLFSALICVVEYSIFIMFLQHYLNDRWERSRKLFCFKFLGLLICSVTLTFINTFQNSLWNVLTVFTLTFILSCIFYQGKWFYVQSSTLVWGCKGLVQRAGEWYYIENSTVNWNYTGLVQYNGDWYYVNKGYMNWRYSGNIWYNGKQYTIKNGLIVK